MFKRRGQILPIARVAPQRPGLTISVRMMELSAETRARHLEGMAGSEVDVLVIGGGITGAGVALDAASRGLSVALVERDDFASGTSGRSSRMIHGGARYLRYGAVGLVYESLRERRLLMLRAPHLVRPIPFLVPVRGALNRVPFRAALTIYDVLATGRNIASHRHVGEEEVARLAPGLARSTPGLIYWDCRTDDARLVIEVLRQAAGFGALIANRAEVTGLIGEGSVRGARVTDRAGGGALEINARMTVNATGAWADRVHALADPKPPRLRPSKGIHLVLDRARLPIRSAVVLPSVAEKRALFVMIPWGPRVYVGPTDTAYEGPIDSPTVDEDDIEVVLGSVERAFPSGLTVGDVLASWAGVRPLLDSGAGATRDLSRRYVVLTEPPGMITVTGGKLTTYRAMAEQVTDRASRALGRGGRSRTSRLPLGLTRSFPAAATAAEAAARPLKLPLGAGRRLVERYGDDWEGALTLIRDEPELGEPAVAGLPVLRVELELAERREMALSDEDVLVRRTRLALMDARLTSGDRLRSSGI
jgi:glycerol-3-phosphate dehydrogenase